MKKITITILTLSFVFCIFSTSFALKKARYDSRLKACYSNQRVLFGAIEMYDMDHNIPLTSALPGNEYEELENVLIQEKYLKAILLPPEEDCSYGYITHDDSKYGDGESYAFCLKHGSLDNNKIPDFKDSILKPFSREYLKKRIEAKYGSVFNYYFKDIGPLIILIIYIIVMGSIIYFFISFGTFLKKKIWGVNNSHPKKIE